MVLSNNPLVKKYARILAIPGVIAIIFALALAFYQSTKPKYITTNSLVSFDDYKTIVAEVEPHRAARLVNFDKFIDMSQEGGTIILDTRSDEMYAKKHLKGAIHLDFTNFTQANLAKIIPSTATRILIYCNNNFSDDQVAFATKSMVLQNTKTVTLALNIPTYINLYGYGYKNIYELSELLSVNDPRVKFEGTDVGAN